MQVWSNSATAERIGDKPRKDNAMGKPFAALPTLLRELGGADAF